MSDPRPLGSQEPDEAGRSADAPLVETTISLGALTGAPETAEGEPGLSGADQAAIDALPGASALLVVQRGPNAGARFLLDAERTTAGRRPDSDIFLDDVTVSRKHAEFVRRDGQFFVRDVGSLNGTYLDRDRIDEHVLQDGDEVQIGKYRLVFHPSRRTS
jgi:pSer/pThr/pTyr-binding forkhead associated (FHA) protein